MNTDPSKINKRLQDLVQQGELLVRRSTENHPIEFHDRGECIAWMLSAVNALEFSLPATSRHRVQAARLLPDPTDAVWPEKMATILGVLKSATSELSAGFVGTLENHFVSLAFEDFLRVAARHNEEGSHAVAAILTSAVLEDTIKRLCRRHDVASDEKTTLDTLINALKTKGVLSKVKAKRLQSHASVRNQAFHAEWGGFDQSDLRQMIEDVEDLLETHFE